METLSSSDKFKKWAKYLISLLILWGIYHWICKPFIFNTLKENKTLIIAAQNGHIEEIVQLLLEKGADVNAKDNDGRTALMFAAEKGHTEIVQILLKKGADVNAEDEYGGTALMIAAENGHTEIIKLLLEKGADVNAKDWYGKTALMYAAYYGHTETVQLLLEKGAKYDPLYKTNDDFTYLMAFARGGFINYCQELLNKGADVNAKIESGWDIGKTALMYAAENGHTEIVKLLLEKGAKYDPFYKTNGGFTYLMAFARCGLTNYCQELLNKGADVNAKIESGWDIGKTALMYAAVNGHNEFVKLLLKKGAK